MAELAVDLTYGEALREAAVDVGKQQEILEEGQQIVEILENEPDLKAFIDYPAISAEEKKKVLEEVFGGKICQEMMNFLFVLIDKRRAGRFERIIKVYRDLLEKEEGVSYGTVFSVEKLSEERIAQLEEQTSRLLRMKVKLENEIDPKLIAGVKILVEGKIIDASYRKRFDEMASQLKQA
ncbi:MAG: ATP synthase F1 subunit delta [Firmicutes bacterium]|nr:ATP synthase F1 subunit delta [Bacillota bacterium]